MSIGGDIADEYWMDYIRRMLEGTGCTTVEELRRKCDWAMRELGNLEYKHINIDVPAACHWCLWFDEYGHKDGCKYKRNYYSERLE